MASNSLWILMMNVSRARIFREGELTPGKRARGILLRSAERQLRQALMDADFVAPPVGRRVNGRSAARPKPRFGLLQLDISTFNEEVVMFLTAHRLAGDFDGLVVFARSGILEGLHAAMPNALRACVVLEVEEDLMDLPDPAKHLRIEKALNSLPVQHG